MAAANRNDRTDAIADRREKVAELTRSGFSQRALARRLDVSPGTVNSDLRQIRRDWAELRAGKYEEYVGQQMARLTQLERTLAPGLAERDLGAIDRAIKILDRRARLLGLDAPQAMTLSFSVEEGRRKVAEYLDALDETDGTDDPRDALADDIGNIDGGVEWPDR